jgi:CBS domain-containing protein
VTVITPERSADTVIAEMLEARVHQFPVMDDHSVVGIVSDVDLLTVGRETPFAFRARIDRADSSEELIRIGLEMPYLAVSYGRSGVDAEHIGQWLGILTDRLTVRLLDFSISRLGAPPVDWAWLALGSFGRREQSLTSDQDHALIYADGGQEHDTYFAELSEAVVAGLATIGFSRCQSNVMASDPGWRMGISEWANRLSSWIDEPDRAAAFFTGIAFDYRHIAGQLQVADTFDRVILRAQRNFRFIRRAAALALRHPSTLGSFNRLKTARDGRGRRGLDLKQSGLFPIIEIARALALGLSINTPATLDRLRGIALDPEWSESAKTLIQVFQSMQRARLQAQVTQLEKGQPASDLLEPGALHRLTRLHLRDDFRVLQTVLDDVAFQLEIRR